MTNFFSNKGTVAGLVLVAGAFMYMRIVVPLLPEKFDDVPFVESPDPEDDSTALDPGLTQPRLKLATAQLNLSNIDVAMLHFNERPMRDPFVDIPIAAAPLAAVTVPKQAPRKRVPVGARSSLPRLTAVVQSADQTAAVIDDRIVRVGDRVGGYQVHHIQRDHVTLAATSTQSLLQLRVTQ